MVFGITIDITAYIDVTEYALKLCHIANNMPNTDEILLHIPSWFTL